MKYTTILIIATMLFFSNLARSMDLPKEGDQSLTKCSSGFELFKRLNSYLPQLNSLAIFDKEKGVNNCFMTSLSAIALALNNRFTPINEDIAVCDNIYFHEREPGNYVMRMKNVFAEKCENTIPLAIFHVEGQKLSDDDKSKKLLFVKTNDIKNYPKSIKLKPLNDSGSLYEMGLIYHIYNKNDEYYKDSVGYFNIFLTYKDPGREQFFFLFVLNMHGIKIENLFEPLENFMKIMVHNT